MNKDTTSDQASENLRLPNKIMIIHLIILLVAITLTTTLTYLFVSNQYLDEIDSQNDQIRVLQNALRKSNGLPEIENE